MIDTQEEIKRFVLVGVSTGEESELDDSLKELEELVKTAGGEACGSLTQNLTRIHPVTYAYICRPLQHRCCQPAFTDDSGEIPSGVERLL